MKSSWHLLSDGENGSFLERLLKNRGIGGAETEGFIKPPFPDLGFANASLGWKGSELTGALDLIRRAIADNRPIIIHGDYDVDGIVATAILWRTIYQDLGYRNCRPFMPNRFEHGYGLSRSSIDSIISGSKRGPLLRGPLMEVGGEGGLLITVDCGITAKEAVDYAKSQGFDVLIIDHHSQPSNLPDCRIFWSALSCAGTLSWIVSQSLDGTAAKYLDLAALATVADLQPLLKFNRSLVKFGLEKMADSENLGLRSLIKTAGLNGKAIGTFEVGWILSPRINAAGRLESAWEALRLLCTKNQTQALKIAEKLNGLNQERQTLTQSSLEKALEIVGRAPGAKISLVVHEELHEGIIGLIAGKLVSRSGLPAVVISKGVEFSKASARSAEGFNIVEFLRSLGDHFEDIGGHAGAAGFTIRTEKIDQFRQAVESRQGEITLPDPVLRIDTELSLSDLDSGFLSIISQMEPFGLGNSEPLFLLKSVTVGNVGTVGSGGSHLKLVLKDGGSTWPAIFFGGGASASSLFAGDRLDLVFAVGEDRWNGSGKVLLKVKDLDKVGEKSY